MSDSLICAGQRFGMYTVVEQAEGGSAKQRKWLCQCDCGEVRIVPETSLKRGCVTGCGCGRYPDLAGKHIGRLTVVERSDKYASRGKRKSPLWRCLCDCGSITYKATDTLTNASISMCRRCAEKYTASKAREGAGFVDGTQLTKITNLSSESKNMTGVRGVYFETKTQKYRARIRFQGKMHNLGRFDTLEEAVKARLVAEDDIFGGFLQQLETKTERTEV